ncbi:YraN family protein [Pseudothermotoga thermarum]|uniref:UPF0102 protein Theth_1069 n=1 Tax=Pseudothermotoga thermarum DSM 5069 TaxID=688269 RepID=F7YYV6_9THEM|nr:YraN family protein [Pseudothermotoga thermarum]AEH51149.1 Uncharacterized protein family UPF0102 [Pseudothermotoga thermarum DSM 5069]
MLDWRDAERLAVEFLKKKGFKIIEKNYRTRFGEIDIIARYKKYLVFVEVKSGKSEYLPRTKVDERKLRKIEMAANDYLKKHPLEVEGYRIDVVEITQDGIEHFEGINL